MQNKRIAISAVSCRLIAASRLERGLSSITVLLISVVAMLWLASITSVILPAYNEISRGRQQATLRMDLESSLNWAVDQLSSSTSPIDDKSADGVPVEFKVPADVVTDGSQVTLSVNNLPPGRTSGTYVESLDNTIAANNIAENGWRVVIARGARAGIHKAMRAVLMPAYGNGGGPTAPIFDYALFAAGDVTVEDGAEVSIINSESGDARTSDAVLASNDVINIAKGSDIKGSVRVSSAPGVVDKKVLHIAKGATVRGVAQANGLIDVEPGAKVLNEHKDPAGAIQQKLNLSQKITPPVLSAPPDAINLGSLDVSSGKTLSLPPGNYVVHQLSLGKDASLNVQTGGGEGPVNLFIRNASSGIVMNLGMGSRFNAGGKPANLRVWAPRSGQMNIGMNSVFNGVVNAPAARIQVDKGSAVTGALIGSSVRIKKDVKLIYDMAVRTGTSASGLTYSLSPKPVDHMEALSWQELEESDEQ